ncbi:MAG: thiamine-binding protein [Thermoplasmata archaeon]
MEDCERVVTTIKMDDRKGSEDAIKRKVESVERRLGKGLQK